MAKLVRSMAGLPFREGSSSGVRVPKDMYAPSFDFAKKRIREPENLRQARRELAKLHEEHIGLTKNAASKRKGKKISEHGQKIAAKQALVNALQSRWLAAEKKGNA